MLSMFLRRPVRAGARKQRPRLPRFDASHVRRMSLEQLEPRRLLTSIHGQKWHDTNVNGQHDSGEVGLNDWTIELRESDGALIASTTTADSDLNGDGKIDPETERGLYSFEGLLAGTYTLGEIVQPGWGQSTVDPLVELASDLDENLKLYKINCGLRNWHGADERWVRTDDEIGQWYYILPNGELYQWDNVSGNRLGSPLHGTLIAVLDPMYHTDLGLLHEAPLPTSAVTTLDDGVEVRDVDFGNYRTASVAGRKWHDANANGAWEPDEPALNGWTIELVDASGQVVSTTVTTDRQLGENESGKEVESGWYQFDGLRPGSYSVREVPQEGWVQISPPSQTYVLSLDDGAQRADANFGNYQLASISGRKWHDVNANGVWDTDEPAFNGWTIELIDQDGQVVATSTTADVDRNADGQIDPLTESGWYQFENLKPDSYTAREVAQVGWVSSFPDAAGHAVDVRSAGQVTGIRFGNYQGETICGRKWHDLNADGIGDSGEPAMNGWTIELIDQDGQVVATRLTADVDLNGDGQIDPDTESGRYCFDALKPGTFTLREVSREGWVQSAPADPEFKVELGTVRDAVDGRAFTIADRFFEGQGGQGTHLHASSEQPVDPISSTVFAANVAEVGGLFGDEEIRGLAEFDLNTMPLAERVTLQFAVADISGDLSDLSVGGLLGQSPYTGNIEVVAYLGNRAEDIEDFQADAIGVVGSFPASGLAASDLLAFDVTDIYNQQITAGNASLGFRLQVSDDVGVPDDATTFGDFELTVAQRVRVVDAPAGLLGPGTRSQLDVDFGNYQPASISGRMWHDANADGQWDSDELALNGWVIEMIDARSQVTTTATTANIDLNADGQIDPMTESGWFQFDDVTPGRYVVSPTLEDGWVPTTFLSPAPEIVVDSGASRLDLSFGNTELRVYFVDFTPNPRAEPVDVVHIVFTHAVDGFDLADLQLLRTNDSTVEIAIVAATLTSPDDTNWTVGNLTDVTSVAGIYDLILDASEAEIAEVSTGSALITDSTIRWINGPGDADVNGIFNQIDIVQVLQRALFLAGPPATWGQGDWTGDNQFGENDLSDAIDTDHYLDGPFGDPESSVETLAVDVAIEQLDTVTPK